MENINTPPTRAALITGAAKRIGRSIAEHLHMQGYDIIIHYNKSDKEAKALQAHCLNIRPDSASLWQQAFEKDHTLTQAAKQLAQAHPHLALVVHNASVFLPDPSPNEQAAYTQTQQTLMHCNAEAPALLDGALQGVLEDNAGHVIHITDCQSADALPGYHLYRASKEALTVHSQTLALQYAPNVRVNAIALGPFLAPTGKHHAKLKQTTRYENNPLQRHGQLSDIHFAIDFLNYATHTTGQLIHIDGGAHLL